MTTLEEIFSYTSGEIHQTVKRMEIEVREGRTILFNGRHGENPLSLFLDVGLKTLGGEIYAWDRGKAGRLYSGYEI
jgi:hypothetical protein